MTAFLHDNRASGILAHITSLPSPYGIGDIGPASVIFMDYLADCAQKFWQILPIGPTSLIFDSSPYMSTSAFAGSPLLISPELLFEKRLISKSILQAGRGFSPYKVNFEAVTNYKLDLLKRAFNTFTSFNASKDAHYQTFIEDSEWLEDYVLFMALKDAHGSKAWFDWPRELATRKKNHLDKARKKFEKEVEYYRFEQFIFHSQWSEFKRQANERGIKILGDIPIYIGLDSADVWSHQNLFELNPASLQPRRVSGVPPDYFSKTGQRWGNPLYRWGSRDNDIRDGLLAWWIKRFKTFFHLFDAARIDHFRGFESYWAIPEHEETAVNGTWLKGPGASFFKKIQAELGDLNIIAEDLGEITPAVIKLRDTLNFPGMKVLHFAFDGNPDNAFLPYNFTSSNCVVYTGTHDNDTTVGWYLSRNLDERIRKTVKKFANRKLNDESGINEDLIYLAHSSSANLSILPLQDLLGFGSDCRMNTPGVPTGNWQWRCAPQFLSAERAEWLKEMTLRFGR